MDSRKAITRHNYSSIYKLYTEDFGSDNENFDLIDKAIEIIKQEKLTVYPAVDLGTGPGNVLDYLVKHDLTNILAVDFTPEFCELLKKRYQNSKNIKIVQDDFVNFVKNQKPSSVGGYFASYSIIHIPDEEIDNLFSQIEKSLISNGVFVMSAHKGKKAKLEIDPYQVQRDSRLKTKETIKSYVKYFMEDELKERLTKAKLNILDLRTYECSEIKGDYGVPKIWVLAQKYS